VVAEDAVAAGVAEHAGGVVGGDVAESVVVILPRPVAQLAEPVQEVPREQPDADAQLQDEQVGPQGPLFLGGQEAGEEDLGGADRLVAVVVDEEGDRLRVADEGQAAALAQVLLAQLPLETVRQGAEVLEDQPARLCPVEDG
jgi:hypothetical protein